MHGREIHTTFWLEIVKGREHLEDLGVDWDDIRMDLKEIGWQIVDWMHLAQDRDQWRALVNTVMNLLVPEKSGISSLAE
jgi:hypothetical protein